MEPLKEITLYLEGLSEADKEKLLSVLVLAEFRLKSSWVVQAQQENADVCLYKELSSQAVDNPGPVICYVEPNTDPADREQEGVFFLHVDATGVPLFSVLVSVLNQVDDWLARMPERDVSAPPGGPVNVEALPADARSVDVPSTDQSAPDGRSDDTPSAVRAYEADIPTLTPVEDAAPAKKTVLSGGLAAIDEQVPQAGDEARKLPWLRPIAEYIQNLEKGSHYHKILLQSGEVILLDFDQEKFYSSAELESFLEGNGDNKTSYISSMDRQGFITELHKQDCFERPLSNLKWFMALYSNVRSLVVDIDNQVYMLSAWPANDLPGLQKNHLKLAAFMRAKRASIAEISAETGIAIDLIQSFVEACYYEGLIQTDREVEEKSKNIPEKPRSFWGGVLRKIKW